MEQATIEAWDAICKRATEKSAGECGTEMVPLDLVLEPLFELLEELGPRSAPGLAPIDDATEQVVCLWFKSAFIAGVFLPTFLQTGAQDAARDMAQMAFMATMLASESGMLYGPVPAGLRGRHLAMAALALEILEKRSAQRLLDQQRRIMN
jgi:hypothetical protein